jgi:hypothetical protein
LAVQVRSVQEIGGFKRAAMTVEFLTAEVDVDPLQVTGTVLCMHHPVIYSGRL